MQTVKLHPQLNLVYTEDSEGNLDPRFSSPESYKNNRKALYKALNISSHQIIEAQQIHSARILKLTEDNTKMWIGQVITGVDGFVTNQTDVSLILRVADCVPVVIFDPEHLVLGIFHAGWKGTVKRIVAKTLEVMIQAYQSNPKDIQAGIGPSIGPDHYEVGEDVIQQVTVSFQNDANSLLIKQNGSTKLDLWSANQLILEEAGVTRIQCAKICTACNTQEWYSHRKENGKTGRFGAAIALKI